MEEENGMDPLQGTLVVLAQGEIKQDDKTKKKDRTKELQKVHFGFLVAFFWSERRSVHFWFVAFAMVRCLPWNS